MAISSFEGFGPQPGDDPLARLPNYSGREAEIRQYFKDSAHPDYLYAPYVGLRRAPFVSATVHVDRLGRRYDPAQPVRPVDAAFFGDLTIWGFGEIDANTIPAQFTAVTLYEEPSTRAS